MNRILHRSARSARVSLATELGTGVDGAWWPCGASVAAELPELVTALQPQLGIIDDICVNWSVAEGPSELRVTAVPVTAVTDACRPPMMRICGTRASAMLLVVPSTTSLGLATLVLRRAAGLDTRSFQSLTELGQCAHRAISAAHEESSQWAPPRRRQRQAV